MLARVPSRAAVNGYNGYALPDWLGSLSVLFFDWGEDKAMKLKSAKRKFKNQWLAFKYTNESKDEGQVLLHEKTRKTLYQKLDLKKAGGKVYE